MLFPFGVSTVIQSAKKECKVNQLHEIRRGNGFKSGFHQHYSLYSPYLCIFANNPGCHYICTSLSVRQKLSTLFLRILWIQFIFLFEHTNTQLILIHFLHMTKSHQCSYFELVSPFVFKPLSFSINTCLTL